MVMVLWMLVLAVRWSDASRCLRTLHGKGYPLTIGMLSASANDLVTQKTIQERLERTSEVQNCFQPPHYINLLINETLKLPEHGWTYIQSGIKKALTSQGAMEGVLPNLIIGPFYTNLAMMLQRIGIPYLITAYKGFDWIDMSRVQDTIHWKTLVEIRPPAQALNLAVVDLFITRKWNSALMIMPESAADNQECQNLAGQMLNNSLSLIPFTVEPRSPKVMDAIQETLRNAQISRQTQIIVCSPRDTRDKLIESVLVKAKPFGLLQDVDFSFIFIDPTSYLLPFSGASEMYRLGLFSARCELLAYRYVRPPEGGAKTEENNAAAIDAARVTSLALKDYLRNQSVVTDTFDAERFLKVLKSVRLRDGNTGRIQFDQNGQRTNYSLYLYNHGGEDMYKTLAKWNPAGATPETRMNMSAKEEVEHANHLGIFPDLVKIVVVEEYPFVIPRDPPIGDERYEGFTIDLIKRLSRDLKFKYEIYRSPRNFYGALTKNKTWDGMVQEIITGNATLACGAISITAARESVIDFSLGVLSTGVNLLVKRPKESFTIFQFMMPFSLELWMAILGASALVTVVFFVMDYCSEEDRRFTIKETIWFTIGTLLKRGTDFAPVPVSQRILTAGFLFFVLITVSTYTANMAAFLTIKNFGETIDSFEALAVADNIGVSTVKGSATMAFLTNKTHEKQVYEKLSRKVRGSNGAVANATRGLLKVQAETHAFIFDYLINEAAQNIHCDVMAVGSPILLQEHGIGMKAGAPFKTNINIALLKLKEEGFMAKMKKKWWDDKRRCEVMSDSQRTGEVKFGLDHTAGVFIVGLFGVCVSAMLFVSKKVWLLILRTFRKYQKKRKNLRTPEQDSPVNNGMDEAKRERLRLYYGDNGEAV